jgi:hypothetical protein
MKTFWEHRGFTILILLAIIVMATVFMWPKKEFPVRVGQVWESTQFVIPYIDNRAQKEVSVVYVDSVYKIDIDGKIYYIRNGVDSLDSDLENFTYQSTIIKK